MKLDRILITGAAGFIGFHLAEAFLKEGTEVIGIDNFTPSYPTLIKEERIKTLETNYSKFKNYRFDLNDQDQLNQILSKYQFPVICHLAAIAGVRDSIKQPHRFVKSNVNAFLNILESAKNAKNNPRIVYASSSSVYGKNTNQSLSETHKVDTPISLYAATKKADELMAHCYSHLFGIQTIGLRFFTVYGAFGRPDMAMWIFTEKILNNQSLPIFGYGRMKRDFSYIGDIILGIKTCCTKANFPIYEIYNLGNDKSELLDSLIQEIEKATGKKAIRKLLPMQPGDVADNHADISKAKRDLSFSNKINISKGVPIFVEWYHNHPEIAKDVFKWRKTL